MLIESLTRVSSHLGRYGTQVAPSSRGYCKANTFRGELVRASTADHELLTRDQLVDDQRFDEDRLLVNEACTESRPVD